MAKQVTLIVLPTRFLVEWDGTWCCMDPPDEADVLKLRADLDGTLNQLMNIVKSNPSTETGATVTKWGKRLYELLPVDLRTVLPKAEEDAKKGGGCLVLRVHTPHRVDTLGDWIPWEFVNDGRGPFGLRFQIARLSMPGIPPDIRSRQTRTVRRIYNVLGGDVFDMEKQQGKDLHKGWKKTFSDIEGLTNQERQLAANGSGSGNPHLSHLANAFEEDRDTFLLEEKDASFVVHFTCHGKSEEYEFQEKKSYAFYWELDPGYEGMKDEYIIDQAGVEVLGQDYIPFRETRPLVFGNVCFEAALGRQGAPPENLGKAFLDCGAVAFVGTFARVTKTAAIPFAQRFYQQLLKGDISIGEALLETKRSEKERLEKDKSNDPSYLFYSLYGVPDTRFELTS